MDSHLHFHAYGMENESVRVCIKVKPLPNNNLEDLTFILRSARKLYGHQIANVEIITDQELGLYYRAYTRNRKTKYYDFRIATAFQCDN